MGKAAPRLLIFFAFILLPAVAAGQGAPLEIITPEAAYSNFTQYFRESLAHLDKGEKALARQSLLAALSAKWDGGLGDLIAHAGLLLQQAEKVHKNGDPELAAYLVETAERLAPGSVEVQIALSRYHLGGAMVSPGAAFGHCLSAATLLRSDPLALYRALGRLFALPTVLMGIFGIGFALILCGRYLVLLMHDLKDLFPAGKLTWWLTLPLAFAILFLPLSAGFSWWWLISWWMIAFFIYMKTSERVTSYIWFALLLAAPQMVRYYSVAAANRAEPVLMAAIRARGGVPAPGDVPTLTEALAKNPDDLLARMALADLLRRQGSFNAAAEAYAPAFKDSITAQAAYNNVAEIYYAVGDYKSAFNAMNAAQKAGPPRVEIFHNLGQYYQATEQLAVMGEQYKKARELDGKRADELQQRTEGLTEGSRVYRLNRVLAAIEIPNELFSERSLRGSAFARLVESGVWRRWWGVPAGVVFQATVGACILLLALLHIFGRNWRVARRCGSCGRPICSRCHRPAKDSSICSPCYNVFKGEGGVDLQVKMQKRAEVQRYRDLWSRLSIILSLIFPGSGQLLLGFTGSGLVFFGLAGLVAAALGSALVMWPARPEIYSGGLCFHVLVLGVAYLVLMISSALVMRAKVETWR